MTLNRAAERVEALKPGPKCGFGKILRTLTADDLAYFDTMVSEGRPGSFIGSVFREDGHKVSDHTVRRHMNRQCGCH